MGLLNPVRTVIVVWIVQTILVVTVTHVNSPPPRPLTVLQLPHNVVSVKAVVMIFVNCVQQVLSVAKPSLIAILLNNATGSAQLVPQIKSAVQGFNVLHRNHYPRVYVIKGIVLVNKMRVLLPKPL